MEGKFHLSDYNRETLTFEEFTKELSENRFAKVELHHFTHQLSEKWRDELLSHKNIRFYDLNFIDYDYISSLYRGKIITEDVKNFRGVHNITIKTKESCTHPVHNLTYASYRDKKVDSTLFYNKDIKERIETFYKKDFDVFKKKGVSYDLGIIHMDKPFETTPSLLKRFKFVRKKDHMNSDMFCVDKSNLKLMLLTALNTPGCKGFNTLGFMKKEIITETLIESKYFTEDDGIYIKIES